MHLYSKLYFGHVRILRRHVNSVVIRKVRSSKDKRSLYANLIKL